MPNPLERRRSPRVPVANHGALPASIYDVSLGGLRFELSEHVPVGSVKDFVLPRPDGSELVFRARVVHARCETKPDDKDVFVVGVEFLADVTDAKTPVRPLRLAS